MHWALLQNGPISVPSTSPVGGLENDPPPTAYGDLTAQLRVLHSCCSPVPCVGGASTIGLLRPAIDGKWVPGMCQHDAVHERYARVG